MDIRDRKGLKQAARASIEAASGSPRKLILVYTGVQLLVSLGIALLDYYLDQQISGTGGLSGLELRSILATMQNILPIAQGLLLPFWQLGFTYAMLQIVRGNSFGPGTLLEGFRRFGPSARYTVGHSLILAGHAFVGVYFGLQIFLMTPLAAPLREVVLSGTADEAILMTAMAQVELPLVLFVGGMMLLLCVPALYSYRLAPYLLMDHPQAGALKSLLFSKHMMRRNTLHFVKLDLSMLWFYAADGLILLICYADLLLPLMGITLPFEATTMYFVTYVVAMVLQLVFYCFTMDKVHVTYAHAYEATLHAPVPEPKPKKPGKQPWKYETE